MMHASSSLGRIATDGKSPPMLTVWKLPGKHCILKAKTADESFFAANTTRYQSSVMPVSSYTIVLTLGGHNLICVGGIAAALDTVNQLKQYPELAGEVVILGTPAEEGSGSSPRKNDYSGSC
jgi:hypothetical protein